MPRPKISILLVCYQQEQFVDRAVAGIVAQDMPEGGVEIVVADDHSTDDTLRVVRNALAASPWPVHVLPTPHNLGITRNYERAFAACRGEYVAVLEGDDYWTWPTKLREQVAFLDKHHECPAVCTNHFVHDVSRGAFTPKLDALEGYSYVDAPRLIRDNSPGNFSTFVYRSDALRRLPRAIFDERSYDWIVNICIACHGPIGVLHQPMSVYRVHDCGTWNQLTKAEQLAQQIAVIGAYDRLTGGILHDSFQDAIVTLERHMEAARDQASRAASIRERWRSPAHRRRVAKAFVPPLLAALCRGLMPPIVPIAVRKVARAFSQLTSRGSRAA